MQVVIINSPQREIACLRELPRHWDVFVIDNAKTMGKELFYIRMNQAFDVCLKSKHDKFLIIPDDVFDLDVTAIGNIITTKKVEIYSTNTDHRKDVWQGNGNGKHVKYSQGYEVIDLDFSDCIILTNRMTLEAIGNVERMPLEWIASRTSSGVGYWTTMRCRELGIKMYGTKPSLVYHGYHESVMHPTERKINPLISDMTMHNDLKFVVGVATFKGREEMLKRMIESIQHQVDVIYIYDNEKNHDIADNGKFYGLTKEKEPCYYFTCDDDFIYPENYFVRMATAIERTNSIVTHHGRILGKKDVSYYSGHTAFRCLGNIIKEQKIDVCGTGVTGFRTDYFNPKHLIDSKDLRMSDLIFSLEAKKQGKDITVLQHYEGYIKQQDLKGGYSIYDDQSKKEQRQIEIANEIIDLKK